MQIATSPETLDNVLDCTGRARDDALAALLDVVNVCSVLKNASQSPALPGDVSEFCETLRAHLAPALTNIRETIKYLDEARTLAGARPENLPVGDLFMGACQ